LVKIARVLHYPPDPDWRCDVESLQDLQYRIAKIYGLYVPIKREFPIYIDHSKKRGFSSSDPATILDVHSNVPLIPICFIDCVDVSPPLHSRREMDILHITLGQLALYLKKGELKLGGYSLFLHETELREDGKK